MRHRLPGDNPVALAAGRHADDGRPPVPQTEFRRRHEAHSLGNSDRTGADGIRTKGGARLEIVLNAIEYGGGPEPTAQLVQSSLREVGIDLKIKAQARPPWYEDNYRCATHGPVMFLRATDPDGLYPLFHSSLVGGNFNWSCVKNARLDQMLEQGRREFDPAKRRAIYLGIEQMVLDEALTVPLVDELSVWAFRANVRGVKYNFATYRVLSDAAIQK